MNGTLCNTVRPEDYAEIHQGVEAVKRATSWFKENGARIEIPHPHRYWEYGSAVQAVLTTHPERMDSIKVLDIGSGWGALGPTLAYLYGSQVLECEPDIGCVTARTVVNSLLAKSKKRTINVVPAPIENLPEGQFDVVFCISVVEHLPVQLERKCWEILASKVKDGGLLFVTTDCVEQLGRAYVFDNLRAQNFTTEMLKERVEKVKALGFYTMGKPDYVYHGPEVCDYTFFRMGFHKGAVA